MEEEPERLAEVKGISEKKAREIAAQMEEKKDMRKAMIFLQQYGISTTLACEDLQSVWEQHLSGHQGESLPDWRTISTAWASGSPMRSPSKVGIHTDSDYPDPQRSALCSAAGHRARATFFCRRRFWTKRTVDLLGVGQEAVEKHIMDLGHGPEAGGARRRGAESVFTGLQSYYVELNTAKMLHDLNISLRDLRERCTHQGGGY